MGTGTGRAHHRFTNLHRYGYGSTMTYLFKTHTWHHRFGGFSQAQMSWSFHIHHHPHLHTITDATTHLGHEPQSMTIQRWEGGEGMKSAGHKHNSVMRVGMGCHAHL